MNRPLRAVLGAAVVVLLTASTAAAGTAEIGATTEIDANAAPSPITLDGIVLQQAAGAGSYAVPAGGGVVTRFRHRAGAAGGPLTFKVYRPTGVTGQYVVVASETRTVAAGVVNAFAVRVPVRAGDVLGLSSASGLALAYGGGAGDVVAGSAGPGGGDPAVGTTVTTSGGGPGNRLDVAATVESDADGDGFGDDTQDQCATDPRLAGPCPTTQVTKRPAKVVRTAGTKARVKITFRGPAPSVRFTCAVDGGKAKPCTSPFKRSYGLGRHRVAIVATSQGVRQERPTLVTFRVKRR
ncbi:hypothetical protein G5V58_17745 [Nocardioides anomalus]|uniref:Ig-like domain repeat protein n=1 Tax=Nocardioides anomalus TaxID=2712223 RepID=A0A6G6WGN9_9ACTN|nr:hypothetical protein [Nocardioides anomalus]QIG44376.1 hypothetical protein G5V58_17745 [Nocardioides anomalus]